MIAFRLYPMAYLAIEHFTVKVFLMICFIAAEYEYVFAQRIVD